MPNLKIAVIQVTPFQQNCSVLWDIDEGTCVVVDPGGDVETILETLNHNTLRPTLILLTHGHLDHAGGAKDLKAHFDGDGGAPVPLLGPDIRDAFLLDGIEESMARFGAMGMRNVRPDRFLEEGEIVEAGALRFEVLHCPGHSPGSIVFFERSLRFAFVGDVIFKGSVGRTDFPYGDGPGLIASIREKLLPLGDDVNFICGHGPASSLGAERQNNPFLRDAA
jgi:glyoxylase-like metal-dependent hydrolase (beta-lactamase superfamily II)